MRRDGYVEIDLTPYLNGQKDLGKYVKKGATPTEIRDAIEKGALQNWLWDYKKVDAKPAQDMKAGEYYIEGNTLHIKLTLARYPHNLIGITKSGKVAPIVLTGKKYYEDGKGYTIPEVQEIVMRKQQEKGDPIVSVFLLANSKDAFKRVDGEFSAAESSPLDVIYQKGTAGIVVIVPKVEKARSEVRNAGAAVVAVLLANPMQLMGQDLTGNWLKLVGDKQIVSQTQDPATGQEVKYGIRFSADGKSLEHFATDLATGREHEGVFLEKAVGPFIVNFVWNRGLRPSMFAYQPLEVRRLKFEVPHDPDTCSFDAGEMALKNRPEVAHVTTHGRIWQVFHNVSPVDARGSFLLLPDLSKPENLRAHRLTPEDISDLTEMSFNSRNLAIHFDGPMSGASQNHIHAKIYPVKKEMGAGFVAVRDANGRVLAQNFSGKFPGLTIEEDPNGHDAFVTRWSAPAPEVLAQALTNVLPALDKAKLPFSVIWSEKDVLLVVREPGMDVLPELPGETWGPQLMTHIFSMESMKNYDGLTEAGIRSAMKRTIRSRTETVVFFAKALAASRSEMRENAHVLANVRRGNEILKDIVQHPEKDFDANVIVTTPASRDALEQVLKKNEGVLFHPDRKPVVELGQKGAGSLARLIDIWPALEQKFGKGFTLETVRGKTVSASLMSGLAKRLSLLIMTRYNQNKGLHPTASGERTGVEQTLWQRRLWLGGNAGARDGMFVFSIDAAIAPEYAAKVRPVEDPVFDVDGKLLHPGQGGFQVFGQEMSLDNPDIYGVTSEEDPNGLGVFLVNGSVSERGGHDVRLAVEKPDVELLTQLKRDGKLQGGTILASHGNYYISWPAYFWITGKINELKQRFPELPPLNWVEALFEAATFGVDYPEQFQKRYSHGAQQNIGDDPVLLEAIRDIAKEARATFGMSFVNLGSHSYYLHANDAEQTWQIATKELYHSEAARRILGVGILGVDKWYQDQVSPEIWKNENYQGRIIGPNVRIADHVKLGPRAIVVGNTVLEEGSDVSGYVRDSIGELDVPDNAAAFSVLIPGEKLTVNAGHFALQYLIKENGHVKAVIGHVATGTRLWQRMSGGKTWADSHKVAGDLTLRELLKVVLPELTNQIYAEALSPEILRSSASVTHIVQGVKNALAAAGVDISQVEVRSEVRTQELPTVSLDQFLVSDFKGPVIIGGTGMIGSHLLEKLAREGKQVAVPVRAGISGDHVGNLLTVYGALAKDGLEKQVTFVALGDSLDPLKMDPSGVSYDVLKQMLSKATVVYHLAGQTIARPRKAQGESYQAFAVQTYVTNVFYTKLIAQAARELGKPMVYSSSQEVLSLNRLFPEPMAEPVTEKDVIPFHPVTKAFISELQKAFDGYVAQYVSRTAKVSPLEFTRDLLNQPLVERLDEPGKFASLIEAVNSLDERYYPAKEQESKVPAEQQPRVTKALQEIGAKYPLDLLFGNYGISKVLAERDVLGLGTAIVFRFVNVYGKGMHPNVLSFYLDRLQSNQEKIARGETPVAIHFTDHMRDFMAAAEVAGVLSGALGVLEGQEKRRPEVLHVGTGHIYGMLEVLQNIAAFMGIRPEAYQGIVEQHGDQPLKVMARADYEALNKALPGMQPKRTISEGLRAEAKKLEAQKRAEVREQVAQAPEAVVSPLAVPAKPSVAVVVPSEDVTKSEEKIAVLEAKIKKAPLRIVALIGTAVVLSIVWSVWGSVFLVAAVVPLLIVASVGGIAWVAILWNENRKLSDAMAEQLKKRKAILEVPALVQPETLATQVAPKAPALEAQANPPTRSEVPAPISAEAPMAFRTIKTLDSHVVIGVARAKNEPGVLDVSKRSEARYVVKGDGLEVMSFVIAFVPVPQIASADPLAPSVMFQEASNFSRLPGVEISDSRFNEIKELISDQWAQSMADKPLALNPIEREKAEALMQAEPPATEAALKTPKLQPAVQGTQAAPKASIAEVNMAAEMEQALRGAAEAVQEVGLTKTMETQVLNPRAKALDGFIDQKLDGFVTTSLVGENRALIYDWNDHLPMDQKISFIKQSIESGKRIVAIASASSSAQAAIVEALSGTAVKFYRDVSLARSGIARDFNFSLAEIIKDTVQFRSLDKVLALKDPDMNRVVAEKLGQSTASVVVISNRLVAAGRTVDFAEFLARLQAQLAGQRETQKSA
jgi:nucleoside-diphosphate-sugar epimerase